MTDNRTFWKTVKPCFSDKINSNEQITLVEDDEVISDDLKISNIMVEYFNNIVNNLDIPNNAEFINNTNTLTTDNVSKAIFKYDHHPSILKIKEKNLNTPIFKFRHTTLGNIKDIILELDITKATCKNGIPAKLLKQNCDIMAPLLFSIFNHTIDSNIFPDSLKVAEIKPSFKTEDRQNKKNYRPISLLTVCSKIIEKILEEQMNTHFNKILSPLQCGFRKGHCAQHCLLMLIEKLRYALDFKQSTGIMITDLSKAFDCIRHDLFIAKCHAYGFEISSLKLMYDYLTNRKQRVRINNSYSEWKNIIHGVPQGSILGPLIFNIYICDLFYLETNLDIVNYADDTTPYTIGKNINEVIKTLEECTPTLFSWINQNFLKINAAKSKIILSGKEEKEINIQSSTIVNIKSHKILGIIVDNELKFDIHINKLCNKASQKLHALARISNFMSLEKRKVILKAFILSQFNYCPLLWMFHSRKLNNKINNIHERALRITYKDKTTSFTDLLVKDNSVTIHQKNLQVLATEIFKFTRGYLPSLMESVFKLNDNHYNLRSGLSLQSRNLKTVNYGENSISNLAPKIWNLVPEHIKSCSTIESFKNKIKSWTPEKCPCRLCRTYIPNLGFI